MSPKVYVANAYGFSEAGRFYLKNYVMPRLVQSGFVILDPWKPIMDQSAEKLYESSRSMSLEISLQIGSENSRMLRVADVVIAFLDGADVDSGIAAEVGFACGIGKKVFGYRGDYRPSGDSPINIVNLQVESFISQSGGKIYVNFDELLSDIKGIQAT